MICCMPFKPAQLDAFYCYISLEDRSFKDKTLVYTRGFPKLADEKNYAHITNDETSELETTYKLSSFVKW